MIAINLVTTKKCIRGHEYAYASIQCPKCKKDNLDAWRAASRERLLDYSRCRYATNKDDYNAKSKSYYEEHKEEMKAKTKAWCSVNASRMAEYRVANREKISSKRKAYVLANKDKFAAQSKKYKEANRRENFQYHIDRQYGLSVEEYARMLNSQCFKCAACCVALLADRGTHIDHNHETGKVRAILCSKCNKALGLMQESPTKLRALADYIERFK